MRNSKILNNDCRNSKSSLVLNFHQTFFLLYLENEKASTPPKPANTLSTTPFLRVLVPGKTGKTRKLLAKV